VNGDGLADHGLGHSGGLLFGVKAERELEFPPERYAVNFILIPNHVVVDLPRPEEVGNAIGRSWKRKLYQEPSLTLSSGNFSIMGPTPVYSAKRSVSSESVAVPEAQP
jgi:hypothetical protein